LVEREHLALFLEAYETATGETFDLDDSETPDFIGRDRQGRVVGVEIVRFQYGPDERFMRRIFRKAESFDEDAWWKLLGLVHEKDSKLTKGRWHLCQRKILAVMPSTVRYGRLRGASRPIGRTIPAITKSGWPTARCSKPMAASTFFRLRTRRSKGASMWRAGIRNLTAE
jgi:hypothetical protein